MTGTRNTMGYFLDFDDDATKVLIFDDNLDLWRGIYGQVKEWTISKWAEWEEEKPDWFSEAFKEKVPDDMIPQKALEKMNGKAKGGKRRRSSAAGFIQAVPS